MKGGHKSIETESSSLVAREGLGCGRTAMGMGWDDRSVLEFGSVMAGQPCKYTKKQ